MGLSSRQNLRGINIVLWGFGERDEALFIYSGWSVETALEEAGNKVGFKGWRQLWKMGRRSGRKEVIAQRGNTGNFSFSAGNIQWSSLPGVWGGVGGSHGMGGGRSAESGGICVYFSNSLVAGSPNCCYPFNVLYSVELLSALQKSLITFWGIKKHRNHTIFSLLPSDTYLSSERYILKYFLRKN